MTAEKDPEGDVAPAGSSTAIALSDPWDQLPLEPPDKRHLARNRLISATRGDPAHNAFDMLRTRLMAVLAERGWSRIGITAPTDGCGKTFVAANLAFAVARRETCRTVLLDLDLRHPGLAPVLGMRPGEKMQDFLQGFLAPEEFLRRTAANLAVGLNGDPVDHAAEILQESLTGEVLEELCEVLRPEVLLYDLPSVLTHDDVVAFMPNLDGVLIVAGAGITTAAHIRECERLFSGSVPILGVILNRAEEGVSI